MNTTHKNLTDNALIKLINKNDELAIAELLDRYKHKFYTCISLLVKDQYTAEDIFQDACIKIINSIRLGKYNEDGKFISWSMQIARNMALDFLRKQKRLPKITMPDGVDIFSVFHFEENNIQDKIMNEQSGNIAKKLLNHIPKEQREVIILRIFGKLSFKEIANLTDVSVNTALGRMRYGLLCLRKVIEEKSIAL